MADVTLLPCPFCGQTDKLVHDSLGDPGDWFVECERCHLGTHAIFYGARRSAELWNTRALTPVPSDITERVAVLTAHRACCGTEHDPANGKLHGYCIVCGVPWPCEYSGRPALTPKQAAADEMFEALENCAELLNVAMERLGVCGGGDSGQRRADAEFPGGVAALHAARAALAKAGQP